MVRGEGASSGTTPAAIHRRDRRRSGSATSATGASELADAAARQMRELAAFHTFGPFTNPPAESSRDASPVSRPSEDAKVFFTAGGGSDAIDTAGKLARAHWHVSGRPEKQVVLSRNLAYHGVNAYGTSLGGIPANAALFGRLVADVEQVPWDDADALEAAVERPRRRACRRVRLRAGRRRRWCAASAARLPRPCGGDLRRERRPPRGRRGDDRFRSSRRVVRIGRFGITARP